MNILQQIIELGSEAHDATAVASVVAMAPGTVTVVKQVRALASPLHCPVGSNHFPNRTGMRGSSLTRVRFYL